LFNIVTVFAKNDLVRFQDIAYKSLTDANGLQEYLEDQFQQISHKF